MKRDEIMNSTPEQLAAKYSQAELVSMLSAYKPENFDDYLGSACYTDLGGRIVDQEAIDGCSMMLYEWFDENDEERPIDAESLAIAYHLWAAACYAYDRENG